MRTRDRAGREAMNIPQAELNAIKQRGTISLPLDKQCPKVGQHEHHHWMSANDPYGRMPVYRCMGVKT